MPSHRRFGGGEDKNTAQRITALGRELCLFDEHTWGSSLSVAQPYNLDSRGQWHSKSRRAYHPLAQADWLLAQRARNRFYPKDAGLYVINHSALPYTGWASFPANALRGDFLSVRREGSGKPQPIYFAPGMAPWKRPLNPNDLSLSNTAAVFADEPRHRARLWVENIPAHSFYLYHPERSAAPESEMGAGPRVAIDTNGWPQSATWHGMRQPLFRGAMGNFIAVEIDGFAPRWKLRDIWNAATPALREQLRRQYLKAVMPTRYGVAAIEKNRHTLVYRQKFYHPRLLWGLRTLELWRDEPRMSCRLQYDRRSSEAPEAFLAEFMLPIAGIQPRVSCGGQPFVPYTDQLPGTCRDYYAIDGWVHYAAPQAHWLWTSRDAPLVMFGGNQLLRRRTSPPRHPECIMAMLFNNYWYTNFVGDTHGEMEYQFDLVWKSTLESALVAPLAQSMAYEPLTLINPKERESPLNMKWLWKS